MKTPAGKECRYFFGDYHRGRNVEECRLIKANRESPPWKPAFCHSCPVPDMLRHNACPNLTLYATISKGFLGFGSKVVAEGWCGEYFLEVSNPAVGCGHCHEFKGPSILNLTESTDE